MYGVPKEEEYMKKITRIMDSNRPLLKRKRVAAYARVSVDAEVNLHSLNAQVDYYAKLIGSKADWDFVGTYADEGVTGTKKDRPGFQRLLTDCTEGKIDMIITKSISRFARNTVVLLRTVRDLREKGISVYFEREKIDSMTNDGELMLTLLAAFAQEESKSISDNTKWAIRKNFERGIGNSFTLYGYRWNGSEFVIIPEEAETVRMIFSSYLEGMSPDGIAAKLQQMGRTPLKGGKFSYSSIWHILRQIKYTGRSLLQKTFKENHLTHKSVSNSGELPMYLAEGTHPAIIDLDTFEAVQQELEARKELGYLANQSISFSCFTAKIICGRCSRSYRRKTYSHRGHATKYRKWVCGTKIAHGAKTCPSCNLPERVLYVLTADVLETEEVTDELFAEQIERIVVSADHELTFILKDGSQEIRHWENERNNKVYERTRIHAGE
jgi:site-specific DNA recombinase